MNIWHDLDPGKKAPEEITVAIEVPTGSQNKYELDKESGMVKLDRVLYSPMHYPGDYGLIPKTLWLDGDPLDVLVLTTNPLLPGVLADVRPIGVLKMVDNGEEDDKIIAVPIEDPRFNEIKDIKHISEHKRKEIKHFFEVYKHLQNVKVTVHEEFLNKKEAIKVIKKGLELYKKEFNK
ncbi:inorganic pyrophosphatase [archaeon]|nr:inorganic pyrophosphatase [archaeon]|tara:strand:+ start:94 stop:627 length:534 start_codon:yes stop_codon:yes gene_type:complete